MLKKLLFIFVLMLTGCNSPGEDEFVEFGSEFYQQMYVDGEQSQEVKKLHKQFSKYDNFEQHDLYISLEKMYKALGNGESATPYQLEVMTILNK